MKPDLAKILSFLVCACLIMQVSCGGGSGSARKNEPPVADAGIDSTIVLGQQIILDANNSSDPEGDTLTYFWSIVESPNGSNSEILVTDQASFSLTPDVLGNYLFEVRVSDGNNQTSDQVMVIVTSNNSPPEANAGPDQSILVGALVNLNASSSTDIDGDDLSFIWELLTLPTGSNSILTNQNQVITSFTPDLNGVYVVQLSVDDGSLSTTDTVSILAQQNNSIPIANAGPDQTISINQTVNLTGLASSDSDGDELSYLWKILSLPDGSNAVLSNDSSPTPEFLADVVGQYNIQLVVNDGQSNSEPDNVTIHFDNSNSAPIANAGADQTVSTGDIVNLDASGSSDPENDSLTYNWSLTSKPQNSSTELVNQTNQSPSLPVDISGTYVVQLIVNDSLLDSSPDTVSITVNDNAGSRIFDEFDANGGLTDYVTNNEISLPDITQTNGRYRANLVDNSNNITLHFNDLQGRLDAKLVTFPFEVIARNIGIGTQNNSQQPPSGSGNQFIFAGIQVHVTDLNSRNSSHLVIGHRGSTDFTVEGKNTVNSNSSVNDEGSNVVPDGRADIRIIGNTNRTLTVYWQQPNLNQSQQADNWQLYRGNGELPGPTPNYSNEVYVGLITYAQGSTGVPFVGTCDSFEINY